MDLNKLIDDLGDRIADTDYRNARRILDAIERYVDLNELHRSPRLPELNDYTAHVHAHYYA